LTAGDIVYVTDASADPTVTAGAASYIWDGAAFAKLTEYESLDLVINWADVQNRPSSSVAQIDQAVADSHTHANKASLDKIGEDADGDISYNGAFVRTGWDSTAW